MSKIFRCDNCGGEHFRITTRRMVGDDAEHIELMVCIECGKPYRDAPAPTRIIEGAGGRRNP